MIVFNVCNVLHSLRMYLKKKQNRKKNNKNAKHLRCSFPFPLSVAVQIISSVKFISPFTAISIRQYDICARHWADRLAYQVGIARKPNAMHTAAEAIFGAEFSFFFFSVIHRCAHCAVYSVDLDEGHAKLHKRVCV